MKRKDPRIIFLAILLNSSLCEYSKAALLHKSVATWRWSSKILNAIFVDWEAIISEWMCNPFFMFMSSCGYFAACPRKVCLLLSVFCSWSSCFFHSLTIFSIQDNLKCLSATISMVLSIFYYLQFKRKKIFVGQTQRCSKVTPALYSEIAPGKGVGQRDSTTIGLYQCLILDRPGFYS